MGIAHRISNYYNQGLYNSKIRQALQKLIKLKAFISVIPQLMINAPEWTRILHDRILNDKLACQIYHKLLHYYNSQKNHFIYYLLQESVANHLKTESNNMLIVN